MRKQLLAGMVAVLAVLPLYAGIRSNPTQVNHLQIDGVSYGRSWDVSSPTLRSTSGYLAYDVTGKSPKVVFSKKKGPQTTWVFVGVKRFNRELFNEGSKRNSDREESGYTMTLRAENGPFKGRYLARVQGDLVLVQSPRDAATLRLLETTADIEHK